MNRFFPISLAIAFIASGYAELEANDPERIISFLENASWPALKPGNYKKEEQIDPKRHETTYLKVQPDGTMLEHRHTLLLGKVHVREFSSLSIAESEHWIIKGNLAILSPIPSSSDTNSFLADFSSGFFRKNRVNNEFSVEELEINGEKHTRITEIVTRETRDRMKELIEEVIAKSLESRNSQKLSKKQIKNLRALKRNIPHRNEYLVTVEENIVSIKNFNSRGKLIQEMKPKSGYVSVAELPDSLFEIPSGIERQEPKNLFAWWKAMKSVDPKVSREEYDARQAARN